MLRSKSLTDYKMQIQELRKHCSFRSFSVDTLQWALKLSLCSILQSLRFVIIGLRRQKIMSLTFYVKYFRNICILRLSSFKIALNRDIPMPCPENETLRSTVSRQFLLQLKPPRKPKNAVCRRLIVKGQVSLMSCSLFHLK